MHNPCQCRNKTDSLGRLHFCTVEACSVGLQFLSDNGGAYCAHETHAVARELGITSVPYACLQPIFEQHNGNLVNTFRREYASQMDRSTAVIVLAQLPDSFVDFDNVHPHPAL